MKLIKNLATVVMASCMLVSVAAPAFAADSNLATTAPTQKVTSDWQVLSNSVTRGWQEVYGKKYFYVDGVAWKGFLDIGSRYYLDENGVMQTGLKSIPENSMNFYFFDNNGVMQTGWQYIDGKWRFFGADGKMLINTTTPDGYTVGPDGVWSENNTYNENQSKNSTAYVGTLTEDEARTAELQLLNEIRSQNGASPLTLYDDLNKAADVRASECRTVAVPSHVRPDGRYWHTVYDEVSLGNKTGGLLGENCAIASSTEFSTVDIVIDSLSKSESHMKNMIDPTFKKVGLGILVDEATGASYWTQEFWG